METENFIYEVLQRATTFELGYAQGFIFLGSKVVKNGGAKLGENVGIKREIYK